MCFRNRLFSLVAIFISLISSTICAGDECLNQSKGNVCLCVFPNGTGIDLSPSANSTVHEVNFYVGNETQYKLDTFYFHPCSDFEPKFNTTSWMNCATPLSICRREITFDLQPVPTTGIITYKSDGGTYNYLGVAKDAAFSPDGSYITYNNGPSNGTKDQLIYTQVYLVCADTDDVLQIHSLSEPNNLKLAFYSRNACLKQIQSVGRSIGSTLCIIFFSFVIFYLVLGICTKKFLMGATGIEVIPNLPFWSDLPNLVRDGWAFALNGFKLPPRSAGPPAPPNPNSYDSI